jgi:protein-disulfide isomerase
MEHMEHNSGGVKNNISLSLPNAVLVAGILIAGAILISNSNPNGISAGTNQAPAINAQVATAPTDAGLDKVRVVSPNEHIRGNINAPVKIVEYSDLECPFCKTFHATLRQAFNDYGANKIAWIYRQSPIASLHPKAEKEAEASECANELGGNDVFWKFIDRLFEVTTSNNTLDPAKLPEIAQYVGLNVSDFNACLSSGKFANKIADDMKNSADTGGRGTPWSIVVANNGQKFSVNGAVTLESLKQTIDQALQVK